MKKRVLGYVLAIVLCLSLIPVTVFAAGAAISLNKTVYAAGERIVVNVSGITQQMVDDDAFVSIYKAGAAHSAWGSYFYVKAGESQDELKAPDANGSYEMRLYRKNREYTDATFVMKAAFRVGDVSVKNPGKIELEKDAYLANSEIPVKVSGITEQMKKDGAFVAVYKKGAEHHQWGVYGYPNAGDGTIKLVAPNLNGDFEMRLYTEDHFYSDATFVMSAPFKLSGATPPKGSAWAAGEIEKAEALGLIPDSLKKADLTKPITREEFAELAVKLYEKTTGKAAAAASPNPFKDTTNPQILKAFKLGITTGITATTFAPKELTNREQVATMLSRALRVIAPDGEFSTAGAPAFTDKKDISTYALEHVLFMAKLEIIKGVDGKFMPRAITTAQKSAGYANTTREQAIAMGVRSYEQMDAIKSGKGAAAPAPQSSSATPSAGGTATTPATSPAPAGSKAATPAPGTPAASTGDSWLIGTWGYSDSNTNANIDVEFMIEFKADGTFHKVVSARTSWSRSGTEYNGKYRTEGNKLILYNQLKSTGPATGKFDKIWYVTMDSYDTKDVPAEDATYEIVKTADGNLKIGETEYKRGK